MVRSSLRDDRGYTLVELVVSITIISLLASVLVGVFSVVFRSVPDVDARTDDARTLQGVVTWLPQDIDSTPPSGFNTTSSTASGCTLNPGTNLLRLEWSETTTSTIRFVANYRSVPVDATTSRIDRVTCFGTGAGPLGNARVTRVSSNLPALPSGWTEGQLPVRVTVVRDVATGDVTLVTFEVRTVTNKIVRTDSAPKNPADTLPPTSTVAGPTSIATTTTTSTTTTVAPTTTTTTAPPGPTTTVSGPTTTSTTTTSTTTTTLAPTTTTSPPCVINSATLNPTSVRNTAVGGNGRSNINGVGVLQDPVTLTIATNGWCSSVTAIAITGAPSYQLVRNPVGVGPNYTITFAAYPSASELWADGLRPINIYGPNGSLILRTVSLDVK